MNDDDLRDCFAMFALHGLLHDIKGIYEPHQMQKLTSLSYQVADAMLEARNQRDELTPEEGIVAIKKRKYVRKNG